MRLREVWQLVDEVLGSAHGRELTRELVLRRLDQRTAIQALDDNVEPRTVWHALCDELEIPENARWGADARRPAPPRA